MKYCGNRFGHLKNACMKTRILHTHTGKIESCWACLKQSPEPEHCTEFTTNFAE